ncbi:hypothetical protein U1872_06615 [Sphingomonas sp. RB3P16]|uniref:hypothetical protein n=1 Tax=Parasphingomonas frigoris TaxID=3096163 RepID=UPI002FC8EC2E
MSRILSLSLPLLFLGACTSETTANSSTVDINAAAAQAQDAVDSYGENVATEVVSEPEADTPEADASNSAVADTALAPLDPPAPGTPGGLADDRTPISEAPFTPDSAQGAANVVQTYYALIGEQKYAQAYALRDTGAGTPAAFAAGFARYSEYHANIGAPGTIDAGAGQRYVTVPVQVYARLRAGGTPVYEIGSVTLHRAGDIDGATAAQRRWRIRDIALKPAPRR